MNNDSEARFIISAPRQQGQAMGFLDQNGDVVESPRSAMSYDFDAAQHAGTALAARLGRGVYLQPLLFGDIDVDADPIYVGPPERGDG